MYDYSYSVTYHTILETSHRKYAEVAAHNGDRLYRCSLTRESAGLLQAWPDD